MFTQEVFLQKETGYPLSGRVQEMGEYGHLRAFLKYDGILDR